MPHAGAAPAGESSAAAGPAGGPAPLDEVALGFVAALRDRGVVVPLRAGLMFLDALRVVGMHDAAGVYWAGRATLVCHPADRGAYDEAFVGYWQGITRGASIAPVATGGVPASVLADDRITADDGAESGRDADDEPGPALLARASRRELLAERDFAACTPDERAELDVLVAELRLVGSTRPSRHRRRTGRPSVGRLDTRRTVRRAVATAGEVTTLARTAPVARRRPLVVLCDVSGSMAAYARPLLRLAHAAVRGGRRVEVFAVGTRLTRITRELDRHDPDAALAAAADATPDAGGGTRLGDALAAFNERWGAPGLARGADVVIVSDGWDRGDPEVVAAQMASLRRIAHRVVWVNPHVASEGFAPLAAGMAAALPYVDALVAGHNLAALDDLARRLRDLDDRGTPRRGAAPVPTAPTGAV